MLLWVCGDVLASEVLCVCGEVCVCGAKIGLLLVCGNVPGMK